MSDQNSEEEYVRQFTGKLDGFDSKEERAEHQKGLKIYRQGVPMIEHEFLNRAERRQKKKKK